MFNLRNILKPKRRVVIETGYGGEDTYEKYDANRLFREISRRYEYMSIYYNATFKVFGDLEVVSYSEHSGTQKDVIKFCEESGSSEYAARQSLLMKTWFSLVGDFIHIGNRCYKKDVVISMCMKDGDCERVGEDSYTLVCHECVITSEDGKTMRIKNEDKTMVFATREEAEKAVKQHKKLGEEMAKKAQNWLSYIK